MARLVGINHIAVEVGDVDEAIAFFSRIFDDVTLRGRSGNMAFLDMGDQFIALEAVRQPVSGGHFGLVVDDRDCAHFGAQEQPRRRDHRAIGANANHVACHDVGRTHGRLHRQRIDATYASRRRPTLM